MFEDGDLVPMATVTDFLTVQSEGGREVKRTLTHSYLDAILALEGDQPDEADVKALENKIKRRKTK